MAPVSSLSQELLAHVFSYGVDILIGNPHDEPEQTREKYLRTCSLVCRGWRTEAQKLLFRRPFINSVERFASFTGAARAKGVVGEVTQATIHCTTNKQDAWTKALKDFFAVFTRIEWLEMRSRVGSHRVEMEWLAPVAGTLRTLSLRHFKLLAPLATSELSFPATRTLVLDHGDIPTLGRKDARQFFSLVPSLATLRWESMPISDKKTFAGKLKAALVLPPPRKAHGQAALPPSAALPSLTSLSLTSDTSASGDIAVLTPIRDLLSSYTSLKHLELSLDLIQIHPTLSTHIKSLTVVRSNPRAWPDTSTTSAECALVQALLPTLPALAELHANYYWSREAKSKQDPAQAAALASLKRACEERGINMDRPEGGLGDIDDYAAWSKWLEEPPTLVGDEYTVSEEQEKAMSKEETLVHWSKCIQRAFLSPGGVRGKDLDECAKYLYWMQGWILSDFTLDCKLLYVLNQIVHLPDGAIPEATEAKHSFRATARRLAANLGGLENKDGEREWL